ncbi:pentatricopeptide repeat-containing protein At1g12775, mitochondrial-like [Neltuma alba]|uniref:pentatricopeptide repeat-containing protein At1g12775, mitochondrial-like n=1 Tax=Neltuma alba TaxID=207710 RepID=UPI0010A336A7|nr:pentatricopeptide repeat-containing protein At1g12775, mitochondrial-like [Prosopis alba]
MATPSPSSDLGNDVIKQGTGLREKYVVVKVYEIFRNDDGVRDAVWSHILRWKGLKRIQVFLWMGKVEFRGSFKGPARCRFAKLLHGIPFSEFHLLFTRNFSFSSYGSNPQSIKGALSSFNHLLHMRPPPSIIQINKILGSVAKLKHHRIVFSLLAQAESKGFVPSLVTLNILINCYCHVGRMDFAFFALGKISKMGLTTLIKGLCINNDVGKALDFHDQPIARGFQLDVVSYGTLVIGLCKAENTRTAVILFQKMVRGPVKPNLVMYNTLIDGFFKEGLVAEAFDLFHQTIHHGISPSVVTYNSTMPGFGVMDQLPEAVRLFNQMRLEDINPNVILLIYWLMHFVKKEVSPQVKLLSP